MCISIVQGEEVTVEDEDVYTLSNVTREKTGEYKCSPLDNASLLASHNITIHCELCHNHTVRNAH